MEERSYKRVGRSVRHDGGEGGGGGGGGGGRCQRRKERGRKGGRQRVEGRVGRRLGGGGGGWGLYFLTADVVDGNDDQCDVSGISARAVTVAIS